MSEHNEEGVEFPRSDDARPRESKKNQPHYLGDKVDNAVERMVEGGDPLPDETQDVIEKNEARLDEIVNDDS